VSRLTTLACVAMLLGCATSAPVLPHLQPALFLATQWSEVRLTLSPDGRTALWFSRNRPGGAGGYDIWMSRRLHGAWSEARPVTFNSSARDFDPAFSADGRHVYFSSDRPGGAGGDDIYRVSVAGGRFGKPEWLGPEVNTTGNEWAPMLSPDGRTLLFTSNGHGARRLDLFTSRRVGDRFTAARPLSGNVNTEADEFDATFLGDGKTVVFTRARDIAVDDARLFVADPASGSIVALSDAINTPGSDTYAPMLDWSRRDHLTFTTRRPADSANGVDLYVVSLERWKH
jgi:TolB protein